MFHDDIGDVTRVATTSRTTPTMSGSGCSRANGDRLDQEEPFVGRTAEVGDDLGSRVLAARLARDVMQLCFCSNA